MTIPSTSLKGQVALVTGGRRGIGEACALLFAEAGADVAIGDWISNTGEMAEVARKIHQMGRKALMVHADCKIPGDVENMVSETMRELGRIDILVNNAGVGDGGNNVEKTDYDPAVWLQRMNDRMARLANNAAVADIDIAAWDKVLENNVKSMLLCSKAVVPIMVKQKYGNIISIASVRASARGRGAGTNYAISKRMMLMLTEGMAGDLGRFNIRVNAISPGGIITEMMRYTWDDPERRKNMGTMMPLANDLIGPEAIAWAALYLASDLSKYVTAQNITVDAGMMVSQTGI